MLAETENNEAEVNSGGRVLKYICDTYWSFYIGMVKYMGQNDRIDEEDAFSEAEYDASDSDNENISDVQSMSQLLNASSSFMVGVALFPYWCSKDMSAY